MRSLGLGRFLPLLLIGWTIALGQTQAQRPSGSARGVLDQANLFSPEAVRKAGEIIAQIKAERGKDLLVETFKTLPEDKAEAYRKMDEADRSKFMATWSHERYVANNVDGVYLLICKDPSRFYVRTGSAKVKAVLSKDDSDDLVKLVRYQLLTKKDYDRCLVATAEAVRRSESLGKNLVVTGSAKETPSAAPADQPILTIDSGGHTAVINQVLFTTDGKEVITVSLDKTIRIWDVTRGELTRVLRLPIGKGGEGNLHAAALSPDGQRLAAGGYSVPSARYGVFVIALKSGRIERVLQGHTGTIAGLAFSPDGRRLASVSSDKMGRIWNLANGECERVLEGHTARAGAVAFAPNGQQLVTASNDKTARIWSVSTGASQTVLSGHQEDVCSVAWSRDGRTIATGSADQSVRLWEPDGKLRRTLSKLGSHARCVVFSPDSKQLLVTRGAGAGANDCSVFDIDNGKPVTSFKRHNNSVFTGAFSPDGAMIATSGGNDRETLLWEAAFGTVLYRLAGKSHPILSAGWSPDGRSLAWGNLNRFDSLNERGPLEQTFNLAEMSPGDKPTDAFRRAVVAQEGLALTRTAKEPLILTVKQDERELTQLKLTTSVQSYTLLPGGRAVVGTMDSLGLYDTTNGKRLRGFFGHQGQIWAVAPSPDGKYFLSASQDQTLRIWSPDRSEPLLSFFFSGPQWIAWTPQGYYAASPGGEQLMGWHVNNGLERLASFYPATQFRKTLYRPDAIKRLLQAGSIDKALAQVDQGRGVTTAHPEVSEVLPPRVRITAPAQSGERVTSARVEVQAVAQSSGQHPVASLRLLLDGRPYQGDQGIKTIASPQLGEAHASWTVELPPGTHQLAVLASSAVSQGRSDVLDVTYTPAGKPVSAEGNLYVLAIGINAYPGRNRLDGAVPDARAIHDLLLKQKGRGLYRHVESKLLTDNEATRKGMLQGLAWLKQNMRGNDLAIFFYAGHGLLDDKEKFYLLPVDVNLKSLPATAISEDELKTSLAAIPGRILLLLDACHSGKLGFAGALSSKLTDNLQRDLNSDDYGVVTMCAAAKRQEALDVAVKDHAPFTAALLEALSGRADYNRDGVVRLKELDLYVSERVAELSNGEQKAVTAITTTTGSYALARP